MLVMARVLFVSVKAMCACEGVDSCHSAGACVMCGAQRMTGGSQSPPLTIVDRARVVLLRFLYPPSHLSDPLIGVGLASKSETAQTLS